MQKSLLIKRSIITALCAMFVLGLSMPGSLVSECQYYADSVISDIANQNVYPQNVITLFIVIPTTTTPVCNNDTNATAQACAAPYTRVETIFSSQTQATQDIFTEQIKLITSTSDLRGVSLLPVITINGNVYKAIYLKNSLINGLNYVELNLP